MINKVTFRRLVAYLIDIIIVSMIATALSRVNFLNPKMEEYDEIQGRVEELVMESNENPAELATLLNTEEITDLSYKLVKASTYLNLYTIIITFLYFVVFQYFTKGKTFGRLITRIEVINVDGKDVTFMQLLKRAIIINSLITSSIMLIMLICLNQVNYLNYVRFIQILDYGIILVSGGFALYREDGFALHDLFAGTRVIKSSEKEFLLDNKVKEANVVNEKKVTKRVKKEK